MQEDFYKKKLYPLQDEVLKIITACNTEFYLTGGTALSRLYLNHRYSDDLDFFVNHNPDFQIQVTNILSALKKNVDFRIALNDTSFVRIFIIKNEVELKVEFINDVGFHKGDIIIREDFGRIDNIYNILSNKLCALARDEAKDIADIFYLSLCYEFNWMDIVEDAKNKDMWVNELTISQFIDSFQTDRLQMVKWIQEQDYFKISNSLKAIAKDIVLGQDNTIRKQGGGR